MGKVKKILSLTLAFVLFILSFGLIFFILKSKNGLNKSEAYAIYGVTNVGCRTSVLERTDDAVGLSYKSFASVVTQSDFDECYPWSEMKEVADNSGNIFIKIPKFYSRITKNNDGTYKYQISRSCYDGFSTLFVDGKGNEIEYVLVGKYEGSGNENRIYSRTESSVCTDLTMADYRKGCQANGIGYQQYDYLIDMIIKELFTIEFATTDSQSVMRGYASGDNLGPLGTGYTDVITTGITGEDNSFPGKYACKYRGIENLWGNTWTFVDGISFNGTEVYVCTDPQSYESGKISAPYEFMGYRGDCNDYILDVRPFDKNPLLLFATSSGFFSRAYYRDKCFYHPEGQILSVGGCWNFDGAAGLWCWNGWDVVQCRNSRLGGRLCYKPI